MRLRHIHNSLEITCPAKVNLHLELPAKRADGFHEIETLMCGVSIYDRLKFTIRRDTELSLKVKQSLSGARWESDEIPTDDRNLVLRAMKLVRETAEQEWRQSGGVEKKPCQTGFDIQLLKNIPSAAGLGGASSNAAAALIGANHLWGLNWKQTRLAELAGELGSDIPFFIYGGAAICRGRGELVQPVDMPRGISLVVAKPQAALSTKDVFRQVVICEQQFGSGAMVTAAISGNVTEMGRQLFNRLEMFAAPMAPQIEEMQGAFQSLEGCVGQLMSGSGSSYFGLFASEKTALRASNYLSAQYPSSRIFSCCTVV